VRNYFLLPENISLLVESHAVSQKVMPLVPFDSVKAARDPLVQKELLKMALADGDLVALAHALAVIEKAKITPGV